MNYTLIKLVISDIKPKIAVGKHTLPNNEEKSTHEHNVETH